MTRRVSTLVLLALIIGVVFFGPLLWKPSRVRAENACGSAMDAYLGFSARWDAWPKPHWSCTSSTGRTVSLGWSP